MTHGKSWWLNGPMKRLSPKRPGVCVLCKTWIDIQPDIQQESATHQQAIGWSVASLWDLLKPLVTWKSGLKYFSVNLALVNRMVYWVKITVLFSAGIGSEMCSWYFFNNDGAISHRGITSTRLWTTLVGRKHSFIIFCRAVGNKTNKMHIPPVLSFISN